MHTDVLIVGAGPVGLFQVFELGLLGVNCHLVDPLARPGGQCVELYADKPIYDIPGLPMCTGQELVDRLLTQIKPFAAPFHGGQLVTQVQTLEAPSGSETDTPPHPSAPRFRVTTAQGLVFEVKAVVLACGVGAFLPRPLASAGLDSWLGRGVFYGPIQEHIAHRHPHRVWVVGGDEAALNEALQSVEALKSQSKTSNASFAEPPEVTLIHRREQLDAPRVLIEHFERVRESSLKHDAHGVKLQFLHGQITAFEGSGEQGAGTPMGGFAQPLMQLQWVDASAQTHLAGVDMVSVNLGLSPQLGPLAEWGLAMKKKQIPVSTDDFATDISGVFAVGDINTYPGKKKLILSGFHEATLAAYGIAKLVFKTDKIPFEYTTASPRLHARLGVEPKRLA